MVEKEVKIDLMDSGSYGNTVFFNLLDLARWRQFIEAVKSTDNKKSLDELLKDFLER